MPPLTVEHYRRLAIVPASRRFVYGSDASQFGDLHLPDKQGPHPVLILIHGGCWQAQYGLAPLGQLARAVADRGVAVWNIEYRRIGNGGGWPATLQDVAAASDFLPGIAAENGLDLARVIVAGHSAGGHLALWLAGRAHLPKHSSLYAAQPFRARGVLSIGGIPDLIAAAVRGVCGGAILDLIGGGPEVMPDRYAQASPAALTPLGVPHLHVHGCDDAVASLSMVKAYVDFAVQAGDAARLLDLPATGHFEPVDARTVAGQRVIDCVLEMLAA